MKDLKRHYRENYEKLRQVKISIADAQNNVDGMKQQIVLEFERWYLDEFEMPATSNTSDHQTTMITYAGGLTDNNGGEGLIADEEAETYLRAKKHVDTLHRAKKQMKAIQRK